MKRGFKAYGLQENLAEYRRTENSISHNRWKAIKRHWKLYREYEKIGVFRSSYYFICYAFNTVKNIIYKRRRVYMKIAVAGTGYVGLSNAVLLAQQNEVYAVDIIREKVDLINNKKSPIVDKEIEDYLVNKELKLTATTDAEAAYKAADYIIISTPTDYDPGKTILIQHLSSKYLR